MRKKEQGVLTVEATIVLMVFVMFVLFLYNFAGVYRAQSTVSHATIESADAVALESYLREVAFESDPQEVIYLASKLGGSSTLDAGALESLRTADLPKLAKEKFIAAIAKNESEADNKLKQLGIKDGLSGISFSQCHADLDGDNIIVFVEYTVELQFPVFGAREIHVTKAAKAKTFGEILYAVSTSSNNPEWGNTSGDNRVDHGAYVEISATPNFGYRFVKWDDGNTDNPRRVLVTDVAKYKAIFEPTNMGINLYLKKTGSDTKYRWDEEQEYGTVSGYGNYTYMEPVTISATAKEHYNFIGWDDDGNGTVDSTENPREIIVDETHNITAIYQAEEYTITVKSNNTNYGSAKAYCGDEEGTSITVEYRSKVKLVASAEPTYRLKRWNNNVGETEQIVEVLGNATYTAEFERDTCTVEFYVGDQLYNTQEVVIESSINGSNASTGSVMPADPELDGKCFAGWCANGKDFTATTKVLDDIQVEANFITPSITLSGGDTGGNATTFTATTIPENVSVTWKSSNPDVATVNAGKVTANYFGDVVITASFVYNGKTYSASKNITTKPSITMEYYCRRDGFCSSNTSKSQYGPSWYGKRNTGGMRFYYNYNPGANALDPKYGNSDTTGVFYGKLDVTWSQIKDAKKVSYKNMLTKAMIKHDTATTGPYAGKVNPQIGYNAVSEDAYIFFNGTYDNLWYIKETHAPHPNGGYYDYYISSIK